MSAGNANLGLHVRDEAGLHSSGKRSTLDCVLVGKDDPGLCSGGKVLTLGYVLVGKDQPWTLF